MTLSASFYWKHPDSSNSLNDRLFRLVTRGVFYGGNVTPGTGLTVEVSPLLAVSYEGMTIREDTAQTIAVVAGQTNYIVIRAKYNAYGSPTTPTLQWEVLEQSAYNADPEKNYLIVIGAVTLAGGATSVAASDIDLSVRDEIDPISRSHFRGAVSIIGDLPTSAPIPNRVNDFYFVNSEETFYWWDGSAWKAFISGNYNTETENMNQALIRAERDRREQGSGIICGSLENNIEPGNAATFEVGIIETPSVADQLGIDTFSAIINGHYVQPHAREVILSAKPGTGERYDLIFLEIWREEISVPEAWGFPRNPDGSATYTISQVHDLLENFNLQDGLYGDNIDLNEVQVKNHKWVVTKYRFGTVDNVPATSLYNNTAAASMATNIDGNAFSIPYGTSGDYRTWVATSTTSNDGQSWAIPLFVVKRTSLEDHTINDAIKEFRNNERFIFPVYPVTDIDYAAKASVHNIYSNQYINTTIHSDFNPPVDKPSGFLSGMDFELDGDASYPNNLILTNSNKIHVRIRGLEDEIPITKVDLGAPPTGSGYERTLVYLKMKQVFYPDQETTTRKISERHRPLISSTVTSISNFAGMGWKRGFVVYEAVAHNLGASSVLDEHDAMVAAGWTKGDLSVSASGKRYADGGIWSKQYANYYDDESIPIVRTEWAIPIALVHRRNDGAWDYQTNPNGTGSSRPDDRTDATIIHKDDLVDLRHAIDIDPGTLATRLQSDIDKIMRGELRTRMAEKWAGAGTGGEVAGTRILQSDIIDALGSSVAFRLTAPDGVRTVWSDAKEFVPVTASFDTSSNFNSDVVDWNSVTGVLTLKAPYGAHIVTHLPPALIAIGEGSDIYDYYTYPCPTTNENITDEPYPAKFVCINPANSTLEDFFEKVYIPTPGQNPSFEITATDDMGRATEMTFTPSGSYSIDTKNAQISFWVHYDRSYTGYYSGNYGLAEIPDKVHSAILGPNSGSPEILNIGPLYVGVRKTISSSSTITINSSDILSASGTPGSTAYIVGYIDCIFDGASANITSVSLASGSTSLTIQLDNTISATVEVIIAYYTDQVNKWIEIGKGGKSIQGIFSWHIEDLVHGGSVPSNYAFDISASGESSYWTYAQIGNLHSKYQTVFIWTSASSATGPWTRAIATNNYVQFPLSNVFAYNASAISSDQYHRIVIAKCTPTTNNVNGEILVHYTYTPYQGLSGNGGKADIAANFSKLKNMLHGTIVANSDFIITQSGYASLYGGVETVTGKAARGNGVPFKVPYDLYNSSNELTDPKSLLDNSNSLSHAAAVGRLPLAHSQNMVHPTYNVITTCGDFDLDPGREGASVGFFGYAPNYALINNLFSTSNILPWQFVNGLTYLSTKENLTYDFSRLAPRSELPPIVGSYTDLETDTGTLEWNISPSNTFITSFGASLTNKEVIKTIIILLNNIQTEDQYKIYSVGEAGPGTISSIVYSLLGKGGETTLDQSHFTQKTAPPASPGEARLIVLNVGPFIEHLRSYSNDWGHLISILTGIEINRGSVPSGASLTIKSPLIIVENNGDPSKNMYMRHYIDTVIYKFDSGQTGTYLYNVKEPNQDTNIIGKKIKYPDNWTSTDITNADNLFAPAYYRHGSYGRGICIFNNSETSAYVVPVLVPGSGSSLYKICKDRNVLLSNSKIESYPSAPNQDVFAPSNRRLFYGDRGGPIAYSFYGLHIVPNSNDYNNMVIMQLSGGIINGSFTSDLKTNEVGGTALDAFWPSGRPILTDKQKIK